MAGIFALHALIADHFDRDDPPDRVVIGIETDRCPWVQALIAAGHQVFCINPAQSAKYRGRYSTPGEKSDPGDAHVLAQIVRVVVSITGPSPGTVRWGSRCGSRRGRTSR